MTKETIAILSGSESYGSSSNMNSESETPRDEKSLSTGQLTINNEMLSSNKEMNNEKRESSEQSSTKFVKEANNDAQTSVSDSRLERLQPNQKPDETCHLDSLQPNQKPDETCYQTGV